MNRWLVGVVASAGVLTGCHGPSETPAPVELRRVSVLDGDTIDADGPTGPAGQRVRVRLLGIDAPEAARDGEPAQCGAAQATQELSRLVGAGPVRLVADPASDAVDRFGRRLGYLEGAGGDVGLLLIRAGVVEAWAPANAATPSRMGLYRTAQRAAQRSGAGSWATCGRLGR